MAKSKIRKVTTTDYKTNVYDVNLTENYQQICKLVDKTDKLIISIGREEYKSLIKTDIANYCKRKKISLDTTRNLLTPIIIPSTEQIYIRELARMLTWFDPLKISLLLDYHKNRYEGKENFVGLVEYKVYTIVNSNTPIDNTIRLEKIMQWVEKQDNKGLSSKNKKKINNNTITAFEWLGNPQQREDLLKIIQNECKLIGKIPIEKFKLIFTINPTQSKKIKKKIRWIDVAPKTKESNLKSLYEFLFFLKEEKLLSENDFKTKIHKKNLHSKIRTFFVDKNNKPFENCSGRNPFRKLNAEAIKNYKYPENILRIKQLLFPSKT